MIGAKQLGEWRVAETTVACGREHFQSAECAQQTLEAGWMRAGTSGEFGDCFRAGSKQVGNAQFRRGMNRLHGNDAGPDVFHGICRHSGLPPNKGPRPNTFHHTWPSGSLWTRFCTADGAWKHGRTGRRGTFLLVCVPCQPPCDLASTEVCFPASPVDDQALPTWALVRIARILERRKWAEGRHQGGQQLPGQRKLHGTERCLS